MVASDGVWDFMTQASVSKLVSCCCFEPVAKLNSKSSWGRAALSTSSNGLATRWTVCCNVVVGDSGVGPATLVQAAPLLVVNTWGQVPSEISPVPPRSIRPKPLDLVALLHPSPL